jgi:hypothetical protein
MNLGQREGAGDSLTAASAPNGESLHVLENVIVLVRGRLLHSTLAAAQVQKQGSCSIADSDNSS